MTSPRLSFACELETDALQELFTDGMVTADLVALKAGVVLGLLDLSAERADVVRELNEADVPVTAWQLLPKEQGYWYNLDNAPQAAAKYAAFHVWATEYGLRWAGVAVDIEPEYHEFQQLLSDEWWRLLPRMVGRAFDNERLRRAQAEYSALLMQMRADGYSVESYQFPFMVDERKTGSTLLQRMFGVVDVSADREGMMLYTSFQRSAGPGILWSYAPDADVIAVGSTGGSAEVEGEIPPLDWDEFSQDLLMASRWSDNIAVYSLEGCVRQGFLPQLREFDWGQPITLPLEQARRVEAIRKTLRAVLWASAHPSISLAGIVGLMWLRSRLYSSRT